jgi:hypothetical protein
MEARARAVQADSVISEVLDRGRATHLDAGHWLTQEQADVIAAEVRASRPHKI